MGNFISIIFFRFCLISRQLALFWVYFFCVFFEFRKIFKIFSNTSATETRGPVLEKEELLTRLQTLFERQPYY